MIRGKVRNTDLYIEHDNGIDNIIQDRDVKEEKVVIIDADSLLYIASYTGKDELTGERKPDYTEEEYHIAEGFLTEHLLKILSNIQEYFEVERCYICVKGKKNFRHELYAGYKEKRPKSLPIIQHLVDYMVANHNAIKADGHEADDLVYSISETIGHMGIIVGTDKDLRQIPSIFYNYQKDYWEKIDEITARHNLATQVLIGDGGDDVNFTHGIGPAKAKKIIYPGMTDYQYMKAILPIYQKFWNGEGKKMMKLCYQLVGLKKIEFLPQEEKKIA